jgi:hypothetical protein
MAAPLPFDRPHCGWCICNPAVALFGGERAWEHGSLRRSVERFLPEMCADQHRRAQIAGLYRSANGQFRPPTPQQPQHNLRAFAYIRVLRALFISSCRRALPYTVVCPGFCQQCSS